MKKKSFEKIESPYSRQHIIDTAITLAPHCVYVNRFFISAWITSVEEQKILVIDIHQPMELQKNAPKNITYIRMFVSDEDWASISYTDAYKSKWITGRLRSFIGWWQYFIGYANISTMDAIRDFYGCADEKDPIELVYRAQEKIGDKRLSAAHKRLTDKIDAQKSVVPKVPDTFREWVEETALYKSRYIYYQYKHGKKKLHGYCTHCRSDVEVYDARHNKAGVCPKCKSQIIYKAVGKVSHIFDRAYAFLFQKATDGQLVLRVFHVWKDYAKPADLFSQKLRQAPCGSTELLRAFSADHGKEFIWYEWSYFKSTGKIRWCKDWSRVSIEDSGSIFTDNLREVLSGTIYQYTGIDAYAKRSPGSNIYVLPMLNRAKKYGCIEYLIKAGLFALVDGMVESYVDDFNKYMDCSAKRLHDALRVRKEQLRMLIDMNAGWSHLKCVQAFNAAGADPTPECVEFFKDVNLTDSLTRCLRSTTGHKFMKYVKSVTGVSIGSNRISDFVRDYDDYISACVTLELDTTSEFVRYPNDFYAAHDLRTNEAQEIVNKKRETLARKRLVLFSKTIKPVMKQKPKKFSQYTIICPKSGKDIRNEGAVLHHCVGNYVKSVAEGKTMILFVRAVEKPEKSLYTVEFRDGRIVQCRGFKNSTDRPVPQIVMEFVRWFEDAYQKANSAGKAASKSCA